MQRRESYTRLTSLDSREGRPRYAGTRRRSMHPHGRGEAILCRVLGVDNASEQARDDRLLSVRIPCASSVGDRPSSSRVAASCRSATSLAFVPPRASTTSRRISTAYGYGTRPLLWADRSTS